MVVDTGADKLRAEAIFLAMNSGHLSVEKRSNWAAVTANGRQDSDGKLSDDNMTQSGFKPHAKQHSTIEFEKYRLVNAHTWLSPDVLAPNQMIS